MICCLVRVASSRLARMASLTLRLMLLSLVSRTFLATCWVMVEPPSSRRPVAALKMFLNMARPRPPTSMPPWLKKLRSSAARKAWITGSGICS